MAGARRNSPTQPSRFLPPKATCTHLAIAADTQLDPLRVAE